MVQDRTPAPSSPPRRDRHKRARHIQSRGHQEVPLQHRRSPTPTPQTEHGVVHRNHRESAAQQTRQCRARARPQTGHDLVVPERLPRINLYIPDYKNPTSNYV